MLGIHGVGELRCGRVAVWGSRGVEESRYGDVAMCGGCSILGS